MSTKKTVLIDTFNNVELSRHKTLRAAYLAQQKHLRAVQRRNGPNSYLTYRIEYADGSPMDADDLYGAQYE